MQTSNADGSKDGGSGQDSGSASAALAVAAPSFVLLWSTGWIVARFAAPDADPLTFLALRYVFAAVAIAAVAVLLRAQWPASRAAAGHAMASGVLLHAIYLGGIWWAVANGVPAGISALIAALQPIMTAALAPVLIGERVTRRQWLGIVVGICGIALVIAPKLAGLDDSLLAATAVPLAVNAAAMLSVTLGTFYQKRFVASGDLRTVTVLQYLGALAVTLPVAWLVEPMRVHWTPTLIGTMAWSVAGLSIGAIWLLLMLIRRGAVAKAAALIYLVPPTAALMAYVAFGETLTVLQMVGMATTALGVSLARQT